MSSPPKTTLLVRFTSAVLTFLASIVFYTTIFRYAADLVHGSREYDTNEYLMISLIYLPIFFLSFIVARKVEKSYVDLPFKPHAYLIILSGSIIYICQFV